MLKIIYLGRKSSANAKYFDLLIKIYFNNGHKIK